jgi:DNA polymerase-1
LQCSTLTGRLSSIEPNLQNIPIKTLDGKNIRKAFIAKKDYQILSLDYSQIELRVLAVIANVDNLIFAFNNNEDIHKKTASEIFHIDINNVDNELRRKAKAINFGIIYGQSVFGLAKQLNISKQESKEYIDKYFINYPQISDYMKQTIEFAQQHHFVLTGFKRKCFIDNINSSNFNIKSFAQRSAINAIIQGTASDIMRLALRDLYDFIQKNHLQCKMLLQIHDEVLIEIHKDIAKEIAPILKTIMENVLKNNTFNLNIPLSVNYALGDNWFDSH